MTGLCPDCYFGTTIICPHALVINGSVVDTSEVGLISLPPLLFLTFTSMRTTTATKLFFNTLSNYYALTLTLLQSFIDVNLSLPSLLVSAYNNLILSLLLFISLPSSPSAIVPVSTPVNTVRVSQSLRPPFPYT